MPDKIIAPDGLRQRNLRPEPYIGIRAESRLLDDGLNKDPTGLTALRQRIDGMFPEERAIPIEWLLDVDSDSTGHAGNGKMRGWSGGTREVISPIWKPTPWGVKPRVIGHVPVMEPEDALAALERGVISYNHGMGQWPSAAMKYRVDCVRRLSGWIEKESDRIAKLIMWETGKPAGECRSEVRRTLDYVDQTLAVLQDDFRLSPGFLHLDSLCVRSDRAPVGVACCLSSYNFPLNETLCLVIPALLMGNTVVLKPPRFGGLLYVLLAEAFSDCLPPGVLNLVWGDTEVAEPVMLSGKVDLLAFVGTGKAARHLIALHPKPLRLRYCMGLEAKNPAVLLPDADLKTAVPLSLRGALSLNGQRCTALKIFFVHSSLAEEFLLRLSAAVESLVPGMPWEKDVFLTPIPDPERIEYLHTLLDDSLERGAAIVNTAGGSINGSYMHPAILYPVTKSMRLYREEQFGPLVPIVPFDDIREVVEFVGESEYGQQITIFCGENFPGGLIDLLKNQVCRININAICQRGPDLLPFTGKKDSGIGVRSVVDSLLNFSVPTLVAVPEDGDAL